MAPVGSRTNPAKGAVANFFQEFLGQSSSSSSREKGDEGFGEGNFRALFESIERGPTPAWRVAASVGVTPMRRPPRYLSGFGNEFRKTEALPGALP